MLKWLRKHKDWIETECGTYRITRTGITDPRYTLWAMKEKAALQNPYRAREGKHDPLMVGCYLTADEAKERASDHAQNP